MDYVGRDIHLVRSADAVITVGGRMGSLHEFSTAMESHKVVAVLTGSGGLADFIPTLIERIETPGKEGIIFDVDPERIVERVIAELDERYRDFKQDIENAPRPGKQSHHAG
jgi:predicted Rossmann-fold nucleotide-binding protein